MLKDMNLKSRFNLKKNLNLVSIEMVKNKKQKRVMRSIIYFIKKELSTCIYIFGYTYFLV